MTLSNFSHLRQLAANSAEVKSFFSSVKPVIDGNKSDNINVTLDPVDPELLFNFLDNSLRSPKSSKSIFKLVEFFRKLLNSSDWDLFKDAFIEDIKHKKKNILCEYFGGLRLSIVWRIASKQIECWEILRRV